MKTNLRPKVLLCVVLSFLAYYLSAQHFKTIKLAFDSITHQGLLSYLLTYLVVGIPIFLGTLLISRKIPSFFYHLGLLGNIFKALAIAGIFSLPMFAGGILFFEVDQSVSWQNLVAGTIIAGFFEELYFRGFLFGLLFRKTGLGFLLSVLPAAILFACGHLDQSRTVTEMTGIFVVTFLAAGFFAWLYAEWKFNLWIPILLHALMNLSWSIFEYDNTALGDLKANIFRGLTIIIAISWTVRHKKRRNVRFTINKSTLLPGKRSR